MKTYMYTLIIAALTFHLNYGQCNIKNCPNCSKKQDNIVSVNNTYRGQILNELNGDPAMFATIMLTNESNSMGTVADMDGLFSFSQIPDGEYHVTVKLIGYQTYSKNITLRNGIVTDNIRLTEDVRCLCGCPFIIEPLPQDIIADEEFVESIPTNEREQPTAGYEGHNFIEKPAIVYPNPARDYFNLRSTDPITVIEILNITGEVAVDKTMPINNQVDISNLAAGQYFIRIYFENRKDVQIERMIVVR